MSHGLFAALILSSSWSAGERAPVKDRSSLSDPDILLDHNGDGQGDLGDVIFALEFLFRGGTPPAPLAIEIGGAVPPVLPPYDLFYIHSDCARSELHRIRPDGGGDRIIYSKPGITDLAASLAGDRFSMNSGENSILIVDREGNEQSRIAEGNVIAALSPDGIWIAANTPGEDLTVFEIETGTPVFRIPVPGSFPGFSPDGSRLAFVQWSSGMSGVVYTADFTDLPEINITPIFFPQPGNTSLRPSWSPDGTRIALQVRTGGVWDAWTMDPDGGNPFNITQGRIEVAGAPAWSPDGQSIAILAIQDGMPDLFILRADGEPLSDGSPFFRVTRNSAIEGSVTWPAGS